MPSILDDIKLISSVDRSGMMALVQKFPQMMRETLELAQKTRIPVPEGVTNIVIAGMGGSAFGGDVAAKLLYASKVPVQVLRNYDIPGFVGPSTLFICMSYSGNTEETVSALHQARENGAKVIIVTSGGQVSAFAKQNNIPAVIIPGGVPPRAALPMLLTALLYILESCTFLKGITADIERSIVLLEKLCKLYSPENPAETNPAKQLAERSLGKIPVVLGSPTGPDVASYRWKCQFNENAKATAIAMSFPEMDHNEIVNLAAQKQMSDKLVMIYLRDSGEHAQNTKRIETTKRIISRNVPDPIECRSEGSSLLERMLSLCIIGDFVSVYLAVLQGVDPTPVDAIEDLKKELAK